MLLTPMMKWTFLFTKREDNRDCWIFFLIQKYIFVVQLNKVLLALYFEWLNGNFDRLKLRIFFQFESSPTEFDTNF